MNIIELGTKVRSMLLIFAACMSFAACSDDDDNGLQEKDDNPGILTPTRDTSLKGYALRGAVVLPIDAENAGVDLKTSKFTFEYFSLIGEKNPDETETTKAGDGVVVVPSIVPIVTIEKREGSDYTLVLSYDYSKYASCRVSFILGYEGTDTSIPVVIDVVDYVREMSVSHLATGMKGELSWEINPKYGVLPPEGFAGLQDLKGSGEHAENLSFEKLKYEYTLGLDDLFEFTSAETEAGQASIPAQAIWATSDGSEFRTYATFTVCPSRIMEPVTININEDDDPGYAEEDDDPGYSWEVKKEAEELGMDKDADGNLTFSDRKAEFYVAGKDGVLDDVKYFGYKIFPLIGTMWDITVDEETGKVINTNPRPIIQLRILENLPAGEYVLVAHIKKLVGDPEDNQYVDFRMPFVIK